MLPARADAHEDWLYWPTFIFEKTPDSRLKVWEYGRRAASRMRWQDKTAGWGSQNGVQNPSVTQGVLRLSIPCPAEDVDVSDSTSRWKHVVIAT